MAIEKILVIDDEFLIRNFLKDVLERKGKEVLLAKDGKEGIELIKKEERIDCIITDMKMPEKSGMEILTFAKQHNPQLVVILITAFGTIEEAVQATKKGAFYYLIKPFSPEAIETIIEKAEEHIALIQENNYLRAKVLSDKEHLLIAQSPSMKKIYQQVIKIAASNAAVFINGESGTGKEVIAQAIHAHSLRKELPFIKVNCAAIPPTLIESEFFGHEKGSFTGAFTRRLGRFEMANKGTLLLDEITEIPLFLQPKLLRVIQEQEFERVGGTKPLQVDVRFIATSNRNMKDAIDQNIFRQDLYYRLNVVPIHIPPLRERKEDILPIAHYFLKKFSLENHKNTKFFSKAAEEKLLDYSFPGNVRELANIIERCVVLDFSEKIEEDHLYLDLKMNFTKKQEPLVLDDKTLKECEKKHILQILKEQNNNRTKTANVLGISLRTLRNKLKIYQ